MKELAGSGQDVYGKKIRAWSVVFVDTFKEIPSGIEYADALVENDCPANENTEALAIYENQKEARAHLIGNRKVVEVEISFLPPKRKKKSS